MLISTSNKTGGVRQFSIGLKEGFERLGIEAELVTPISLIKDKYKELRDKEVLKILSVGAILLAPICRNVICVAHGFPRLDSYNAVKFISILLAYKIAEKYSKFVAVSHFVKLILENIFNINVGCVIKNPISKTFIDVDCSKNDRTFISYAGRLHKNKRIDLFIKAVKDILSMDKYKDYKVLIVGDGPEKEKLMRIADNDDRIRFVGKVESEKVKEILCKSKVFFSGNEFEALGIAYVEALSCGCNVVMPNLGGGIEIAPELNGKRIFTYYPPTDESKIKNAIINALEADNNVQFDISPYLPENVALKYLEVAENGG